MVLKFNLACLLLVSFFSRFVVFGLMSTISCVSFFFLFSTSLASGVPIARKPAYLTDGLGGTGHGIFPLSPLSFKEALAPRKGDTMPLRPVSELPPA